jgi:hypothetical protein
VFLPYLFFLTSSACLCLPHADMSPQRYMFMRLVYMLALCRLLFITVVSSCAVADHRFTHSRTPVLHSYWSLSMPLDCSFLCVPRLPVMHLFRLDFKIKPAHRTCVTSVQPGASETLAVRRAVVPPQFCVPGGNTTAVFVPTWLLRVSGEVCSVHLILSVFV